jgi:protein NirF
MRKILMLLMASVALFATEKYFVVERENSSLAVIKDYKLIGRLKDIHNMNHGVVKFYKDDGYLISRDGYVVKFDPKTLKKEAEYKTSKSAIGFVIGENFVAVANYDDKSVDILSRDLEPIKKIKTGSRNVGIKIYKDMLIFAQMDSDKVTILRDKNYNNPNLKPDFEIIKEFNVGKMPFDAMIKGEEYIVGFFLTKGFGVINLKDMSYRLIKIEAEDNKPVLKVPHFGFWSISKDKIFIPAVGSQNVLAYDKDFKFIKAIETIGLPVFVSLSPKEKYIAVTFSGKHFPYVQIIDTATLKIIKTLKFSGKVLHLRWSKERNDLYVSVNDANRVVILDTTNWKPKVIIENILKPSGIFIWEER